MNMHKSVLNLALPLIGAALLSTATVAQADTQVTQPTAQTAQRNADDLYTPALLAGDNGTPIGPELVTWLFAGGGILAAAGVAVTDRRVRASR